MDGIDGSFGAISRVRRPETMGDVGSAGQGRDKIINDPFLPIYLFDVILCLTY